MLFAVLGVSSKILISGQRLLSGGLEFVRVCSSAQQLSYTAVWEEVCGCCVRACCVCVSAVADLLSTNVPATTAPVYMSDFCQGRSTRCVLTHGLYLQDSMLCVVYSHAGPARAPPAHASRAMGGGRFCRHARLASSTAGAQPRWCPTPLGGSDLS